MRINKSMFDINELQTRIMGVVDSWVRKEKTPVPYKEIMRRMKESEVTESTAKAAIGCLVRKGYIRKAVVISNRTFYVQLRTLSYM